MQFYLPLIIFLAVLLTSAGPGLTAAVDTTDVSVPNTHPRDELRMEGNLLMRDGEVIAEIFPTKACNTKNHYSITPFSSNIDGCYYLTAPGAIFYKLAKAYTGGDCAKIALYNPPIGKCWAFPGNIQITGIRLV